MQITSLRIEHLVNPIGIDTVSPRFSWKLFDDTGSRRGLSQSAYRITILGSEDENKVIWDSGKVESDQSIFVPYAGPALKSRQRLMWKVDVWDESDVKETSDPAFFEMGLLDQKSDWTGAHWIETQLYGGKHTTIPAPYIRKSFYLASKPKRARLYITALGLYDAFINGQPVTDTVLNPGSTDYPDRLHYQSYDVTHFLTIGDNTLGAILGDGWYCGFNNWAWRQNYGDQPRLLAKLEITSTDDSITTICTDDTWKWSPGPILESDLLMGESYDARHELGAWSQPGYDDSKWFPVQTNENCLGSALLAAHPGQPVGRQEEITPISLKKMGGNWVFDLGQNMVGWARLKVSGLAGTTVTLRFAEMLKPDGNIYTENLRSAKQTDRYTLKGDGIEIYEPRFTFHGFQYIELSGFPGEPTLGTITGVVVHSDMPKTGTFECSDPLINQLQHNIEWGLKGNFVDIPTDCPQRDERLGWTGDAQVFVSTAAFNRDIGGFFTKWLRDLRDSQDSDGHFPMVAPTVSTLGPDGKPAWADAGVICPWIIYQRYGDVNILAENYGSMCKFMESLIKESPDLIRCNPEHTDWGGFGDWLSTNAETPSDLIGTAFFAHSADLLAKIAWILGNGIDSKRFAAFAKRVKKAFIKRFVTADGFITANTQTAYVLALEFNLLTAEFKSRAVLELERNIRSRGTHLSTGFVGTPYLLHVLSDNHKTDLAFELLMQKTWPSWLYPVTQGATTIWERWDGWTEEKGFQDAGMNSFNHYAYGAVGDWLYRVVAGISTDDTNGAGYKLFTIAPHVGGGLTHVSATHDSPYGLIKSAWRIDGDRFHLDVTVPPNTSAHVWFPNGAMGAITERGESLASSAEISEISEGARRGAGLNSGTYEFRVGWSTD